MARLLLTDPGPRPPSYRLAEHLWGHNCDFDSDGDSDHPDATGWTELTVALRDQLGHTSDMQRVDVDPVADTAPLALVIVSENADLARKAAAFLQRESGGELKEE